MEASGRKISFPFEPAWCIMHPGRRHVYVCIDNRHRQEASLGFNPARRYAENGDQVIATVRKPSEALEALRAEHPGNLHILTMDIGSTASVSAAAEAEKLFPCLDLIINNAVTTSPDTMKELEDFNLDDVAPSSTWLPSGRCAC